MAQSAILDYQRTRPRMTTANKMAYVASWLIVWPIVWTGGYLPLLLLTHTDHLYLCTFLNFIILLGPVVGMAMAITALVLRASHRGNLWVGLVGCTAWTVLLMFSLLPAHVFP